VIYVIISEVIADQNSNYQIENQLPNGSIEVYQTGALKPGKLINEFKMYYNPNCAHMFAWDEPLLKHEINVDINFKSAMIYKYCFII